MDRELFCFNKIYSIYYKKSFLYVKSYVQDEMAAEDIVTESLIQLWEEMKKRTIDPISPLLFTILKNKVLDYIKHVVVKQNVHENIHGLLSRELEIRINSIEASDPNIVFSNEVKLILERTLASLPKRTKEIFLMSRFKNKSYKEIAEIFGISVKGVEFHISQAKKALRISLKDYLTVLVFLLV
jgi:RNA polymerase sigma-70 factor (ECF subfamily)